MGDQDVVEEIVDEVQQAKRKFLRFRKRTKREWGWFCIDNIAFISCILLVILVVFGLWFF